MTNDQLREAVDVWQDERTTITIKKLKALQILLSLAEDKLAGRLVEPMSEEEIRRIIVDCGQQTSKYPDKHALHAGENTFISSSQYEDLAHALVNRVGKPDVNAELLEGCKRALAYCHKSTNDNPEKYLEQAISKYEQEER